MPDSIRWWILGYAQELDSSPVEASILGAEGDHGSLGDWSQTAIEQRQASDESWLERLSGLDVSQLDADRKVDVGLLVSGLRGRQVYSGWDHWRRDPATYLDPCLHGVFSLFLNRLFPEPELVSLRLEQAAQSSAGDSRRSSEPAIRPGKSFDLRARARAGQGCRQVFPRAASRRGRGPTIESRTCRVGRGGGRCDGGVLQRP